MLNSLKDLYICYPFMETLYPPEWVQHVKDIHLVVELPAAGITASKNDDRLIAMINGNTGSVAAVDITCGTIAKTCYIPIYREEDGCPATQNYMLVDNDFEITGGTYTNQRIHPDCIVYLQEAPLITGQTASVVLKNGCNVGVSETDDGALLYATEGGGLGQYVQELDAAAYALGKGLRSINGMSGEVWIRGDYPVKETTTVSNGKATLTVTTEEVE